MSDSTDQRNKAGEAGLRPETLMMSHGYDPFLSKGSVKPPVFLTSTFAFRSAEEGAAFFDSMAGRTPVPEGESAGLVYSRFNHPNLDIVEKRLAVLDGTEAAAVTASGMAAISAVLLTFLRPGVSAELREQGGVSEGLIRVSVGLEHEEDLLADFSQALQRC